MIHWKTIDHTSQVYKCELGGCVNVIPKGTTAYVYQCETEAEGDFHDNQLPWTCQECHNTLQKVSEECNRDIEAPKSTLEQDLEALNEKPEATKATCEITDILRHINDLDKICYTYQFVGDDGEGFSYQFDEVNKEVGIGDAVELEIDNDNQEILSMKLKKGEK